MEEALIENLVVANKILDKAELTVPFGHVSVRIPGTDRFLISRAIAPSLVQADDMLLVDLQGKILEGSGKWHGETWIHICVYRKRPEINGVVHTHSLYVTALATAETGFIPATIFGTAFSDTPTYKRAGLIHNEERGVAMAELMGAAPAILLKGHGGSVAGATLEEATARAIMMEEAAKIQILAGIAGKVTPYEPQELDRFRKELDRQKVRNDRPGGLFERVWEHYKSKL
jgi:L-ribulose-5-phosphate 4-epimerase